MREKYYIAQDYKFDRFKYVTKGHRRRLVPPSIEELHDPTLVKVGAQDQGVPRPGEQGHEARRCILWYLRLGPGAEGREEGAVCVVLLV
jgi:hypothetical protein